MAKIGTLIEKLFKKAGIDTSTEELKPLFALEAEIADDTVSKVDKSLLTLDAAKNNSEIIKAIKATTLSGADSKLDELITELGLQPNEDFTSNKNTYDKIAVVTKLAHEAGKKAAGAGNKEGAKEWADKEADYNRQLKELKEVKIAKENEISTLQRTGKINNRVERRLLQKAKELNLPEEMDIDLKLQVVTGAIGGELQKKGIRWELDENDNLIVVDKDGKPAYNPSDNVAYEPNNLIDGALAQNKLLKINGVTQQQQISTPGATIVNGQAVGNSAIVAEIDAQLATMV